MPKMEPGTAGECVVVLWRSSCPKSWAETDPDPLFQLWPVQIWITKKTFPGGTVSTVKREICPIPVSVTDWQNAPKRDPHLRRGGICMENNGFSVPSGTSATSSLARSEDSDRPSSSSSSSSTWGMRVSEMQPGREQHTRDWPLTGKGPHLKWNDKCRRVR